MSSIHRTQTVLLTWPFSSMCSGSAVKVMAKRLAILSACRFAARGRAFRPHLPQDEGELLGGFLQALEPARLAAVARAHVGLEQQLVLVGLELAQAGDPFGGLPVGDARVVEPGGDQQRRIGLGADI